MTNTDVDQISNFLDNYKDFAKRLEGQKIIHFKTKFNGLLSGYKSLKNMIKVLERREAERYNIFDILNINALETKTHTPFLTNLLNPNGTHGQGDLFLKSFIQEFIPNEKREYFELSKYRDYNAIEEKSMGSGRIDIYIHSLDPNKKFGIVIENKIYAGDQQNQLERYYNFVNKLKGFKEKQIMLFYLTTDGREPGPDSIDAELSKYLQDKQVLKNISYKEDVSSWLTNCIREVEANRVKGLLHQYLSIIKTF